MRVKIKILEYILMTFIIMGVGLAVINFLEFRSLWLDETMLARNIIKPINELFKPLDYIQVAPIGFLLVESFQSFGIVVFLLTHDYNICTTNYTYLYYRRIFPYPRSR